MQLRHLWMFGITVLLALAVAGCVSEPPASTLTPAPPPTPTTTPIQTPDIPATVAAGIAAGVAATEALRQPIGATPVPAPTAVPAAMPTISPTATTPPSLTPSPKPTLTPTPTPQPVATATLAPSATPSPQPTLTPTPTLRPTATATLRPTATPRATPTPPPSVEILRDLMLNMINEERELAGSNTVVLGHNGAAQIHADNLLENCISGHWALDGTTPEMRYAIAGGQQVNGENVAGFKLLHPAMGKLLSNRESG